MISFHYEMQIYEREREGGREVVPHGTFFEIIFI